MSVNSGFEWLSCSRQFIQLTEEFDSQLAQELKTTAFVVCGLLSARLTFSEQCEGWQLFLIGLAVIVMGNGSRVC